MNEFCFNAGRKPVHRLDATRNAARSRAQPHRRGMDPARITASLAEHTPRAAAIWQQWLATEPALPHDPDELLAAFARYLMLDSEHADDHPRIIGSALSAVAQGCAWDATFRHAAAR